MGTLFCLTTSAASMTVSKYHSGVGARCPANFDPGLGDQTKGTIFAPMPDRVLIPSRNVSFVSSPMTSTPYTLPGPKTSTAFSIDLTNSSCEVDSDLPGHMA